MEIQGRISSLSGHDYYIPNKYQEMVDEYIARTLTSNGYIGIVFFVL